MVNYCKDCFHYSGGVCTNPKVIQIDQITGEKESNYVLCSEARSVSGVCGTAADLFETRTRRQYFFDLFACRGFF